MEANFPEKAEHTASTRASTADEKNPIHTQNDENQMTENTANNGGRDSHGRFTQGNPGRPAQSENYIQKEIRQKLMDFVSGKMDDIEAIFDKLPDRDKGKFLLECLSFITPKQREIFIETDLPKSGIDFSAWSTEDIRILIALQSKYMNTSAHEN